MSRDENGQIADKEAAKELGRRGGLAKAAKKEVLQKLGYVKLAEQDEFHPYYTHAQEWLKATCESLLQQCDGYIGPGPMSLLQIAAGALAIAKFAQDNVFAKGAIALAALMTNMATLHRSNLKDALDMAQKEAAYRAKNKVEKQTFFDPFQEGSGSGTD